MVAKIAIFPEAEADKQRCCGPQAVATATYYRAGVPVNAPAMCEGALCMAWRWYETNIKGDGGELTRNGEVYGFCGLAGDPSPKGAA